MPLSQIQRFRFSRVATAAALLSMVSVGPISAQVTLETASVWELSAVGQLGVGGFEQYAFGQTFTAPAAVLNSWTYYLANAEDGGSMTFTANVGTWDGSAVGSVLWTSAVTAGTASASFVPYEFNTGGISLLTSGQTYIFYLNAVSGPGTLAAGLVYDDAYAGHAFAHNFYPDHFAPWSTPSYPGGWDMAFIAEFSREAPSDTVPEPATMTLLATGLAGIAASRRKRQRN